jgi:hypothetical protein
MASMMYRTGTIQDIVHVIYSHFLFDRYRIISYDILSNRVVRLCSGNARLTFQIIFNVGIQKVQFHLSIASYTVKLTIN